MVVASNIAGGKSDVFVNQTLTVDVNIDTDGGIFTDLTVERFHAGNTQKDPWWRATNQNFFQVYVNPGAALFSIKGNDAKPLPKGSDYADYSVNPDLAAMESTMIPMPPTQFNSCRHRLMDGGRESRPTSVVAPVVVMPEMVSK